MIAVYDSQMMSATEFREIALGFPEAEERSHMNHPDFRVGGKIFATLGYPNKKWGMAALTPPQQQEFLRISPDFKPAAGKWGEAGATIISLETADAADVHKAVSCLAKLVGKAEVEPKSQITLQTPLQPPNSPVANGDTHHSLLCSSRSERNHSENARCTIGTQG